MNRRSMLSLTGVALAGAAVPFAWGRSSGDAQDRTEERLSTLETRVAVIETEIVATPALPLTPHVVDDNASPEHLMFTGSGQMLSDLFHLDAVRYFVSVEVKGEQSDYAVVSLIRVGKETQIPLVNELNQAPFNGHVIVQITDAGDYRLISSAEGHGKWTIMITKE